MNRIKFLSAGIFAVALWSMTIPGRAQEPKAADSDFSLNVDVELVQLPVSVLDKEGRVIEGLTQNDFHVFDPENHLTASLWQHHVDRLFGIRCHPTKLLQSLGWDNR